MNLTQTSLSNPERLARLFVLGLVIGLPLAVLLARFLWPTNIIEVHARMPENGGWAPGDLTVTAGQPLRLRLVSDDVLHGFAIGQSEGEPLDLEPGKAHDVTLEFERPGKYVYYCTRWCGKNHWRMRGVIEVLPGSGTAAAQEEQAKPPLYTTLGLDLDAPRPEGPLPEAKPNAARGAGLADALPEKYLEVTYFRTRSPQQTWEELRAETFSSEWSDSQVWDVVAFIWQSNTSPARLARAARLYAQNCAACHGESGAGDGVMADAVQAEFPALEGHTGSGPADLRDPQHMLSASPALLQGKIVRGGMGTGMPYWGPIFSEDDTWALVEYLASYQFEE